MVEGSMMVDKKDLMSSWSSCVVDADRLWALL